MRVIAAFVVSFLIGLASHAQTVEINYVRAALKSGSSKELSKYFNQTVEINIEGDKSNYSKNQAEYVLRDFFKRNPPVNFIFIHQGASKEGLKYAIGKLEAQPAIYRVYLLFKKEGDVYYIDTMDFTRDD